MRRELKQFADVCTTVADKAALSDGFVPVRRLVEIFGAELEARPLLYEGMIAAPRTAQFKWRVLINSDGGKFDEKRFERESSESPLPPRIRFTIAHELVHMLRFRAREFGVELQLQSPKKKREKEVIAELERETDGLAPLLLVPEAGIEREFIAPAVPLTIDAVVAARRRWGVSRDVFVNRLNFLHLADSRGLRFNRALRNIGVGIGVWGNTGASLPEWPPSFTNFDDGLVPDLFRGPPAQRIVRFQKAFAASGFCINGGDSTCCEGEVFVGTATNAGGAPIPAVIQVEGAPRKNGSRFLYLVSKHGAM